MGHSHMNRDAYRVQRRIDSEHAGRWGLWSDVHQRWASVIYVTERDAREALGHLRAAEDRRDGLAELEEQA